MPDSDAIHATLALTMDAIEPSIWGRFSTARGNRAFCEAWLAVLCAQLPHVQAAILLLGPDADGSFSPAASWPDAGKDMQHLVATAQRTLMEGWPSPAGGNPPEEGAQVRAAGRLPLNASVKNVGEYGLGYSAVLQIQA